MSKIKCQFLVVFVSILAMSAIQFFMLDTEDLTNINAVEEQQETLSNSVEVQALAFDEPRFQLFTKSSSVALKRKYKIVHMNKIYPPMYLAVPYSPPELI